MCTRSSLCAAAGLKKATSSFSGFYLDAGKQLVDPPAPPTRRFKFYGDSIVEGSLMSDQPFSNGYLAYPQAAVSVCQSNLRRRANGLPTHRERDGRHLFTLGFELFAADVADDGVAPATLTPNHLNPSQAVAR